MKYIIIGVIKDGHKIVGYRLKDTSGKTVDVTKEQTIKAVEDGLVIGAKIQWYNDNPIIRTKDKLPTCARVINKKEDKVKAEKLIEKYTSAEIPDKIKDLDKGTPLKITFTSFENYKQCLYMGCEVSPCGIKEYYFFDGRLFKFSEKFITNNKDIIVILNDNNVEIVARLINMLKQ